jgi:hypothetical protein
VLNAIFRLCKLNNERTRLAAASDKVCHLLAYGRLFSPGIPASSIPKTDRHDIAEILPYIIDYMIPQ